MFTIEPICGYNDVCSAGVFVVIAVVAVIFFSYGLVELLDVWKYVRTYVPQHGNTSDYVYMKSSAKKGLLLVLVSLLIFTGGMYTLAVMILLGVIYVLGVLCRFAFFSKPPIN